MSALHTAERREWRDYLKACTDAQVQGVYDREHGAGRYEVAELAADEGERRGLELDLKPDAED